MRCQGPPSARCRARCACSRCLHARVPARVALLSRHVAAVQACSSVRQPAHMLALMLQSWAMLGNGGLWGARRACTMGEP